MIVVAKNFYLSIMPTIISIVIIIVMKSVIIKYSPGPRCSKDGKLLFAG